MLKFEKRSVEKEELWYNIRVGKFAGADIVGDCIRRAIYLPLDRLRAGKRAHGGF